MTDVSEEFSKAKIGRRTAKAALTRIGKTVEHEINHKRPQNEVRNSLLKLNNAFDSFVLKHEALTSLITDDDEFDKEEKWLAECQEYFLRIDLGVKTYIESVNVEISATELQQPEGMIGMQDESTPEDVDSSTQNTGLETPEEITTATNGSVTDDTQSNVSNLQTGAINNLEKANINAGATKNEQSCGFQIEKPKLPKFSGDVREYVIFRADFKHTIESRYSKRDAITLLRTCLKDKPLELI